MFLTLLSAPNSQAHDCPLDLNSTANAQTVTIQDVVDGDTIHLTDGRKVRLIGLNTPEIGRDKKPSEPFARAAQKSLRKFLSKKALLVVGKERKDQYGRTLAHVYNLNGNSAEAHLLTNGYGWHIAIPPNTSNAACLAEAEQSARAAERRIWGAHGIFATDASKLSVGGFQRIQGVIVDINFGKRGWWISFGDRLAAVIYPQHQHRFNRKTLKQLIGKKVEIRGWVYPSRSKKYQPWRIKIETPFGLSPL